MSDNVQIDLGVSSRFPSLEQLVHVVNVLPAETVIQRRNRALMAFAILTGARDDAIASLSLKHVDMAKRTVFQDGRDVRTKNRKTQTTKFFPVNTTFENIVAEWQEELRIKHLFGPGDPVFPMDRIGHNDAKEFTTLGISRDHWKDANAIRRIFKASFALAGLPYFNPHSLRKTLGQLGQRVCTSPEEFKAWSQNLGHENVLTTFKSYGKVSVQRQAEILDSLGTAQLGGSESDSNDTIRQMEALLRRMKANKAA